MRCRSNATRSPPRIATSARPRSTAAPTRSRRTSSRSGSSAKMDFNLTKEQEQLSDTIQRFVAKEYAAERRKAILKSKEGFSREVWGKLGELGLLALQVPEAHGGMGASAAEGLLPLNAFGQSPRP